MFEPVVVDVQLLLSADLLPGSTVTAVTTIFIPSTTLIIKQIIKYKSPQRPATAEHILQCFVTWTTENPALPLTAIFSAYLLPVLRALPAVLAAAAVAVTVAVAAEWHPLLAPRCCCRWCWGVGG